MLKNYFTLAIRNLLKRKLYSFINIVGLAIGVAVCLVILKYVDFQLSYDSFHAHADRVFRTYTTNQTNGEPRGSQWISGYAEGPSLLADMPEVKSYVRIHPMYGGVVIGNTENNKDIRFHEENMYFTDSTYFDVFTHKALKGDLTTALDQPHSIVLTESMATKYFGNDPDIIGKPLTFSGGWSDGDYKVTAVIENVPENAHLQFDCLMNIHSLLQNNQYKNDNGWGWWNFVTYVQLHDNASLDQLNSKTPAFVEKYRGSELKQSNSKSVLSFQPIKSIHLGKDFGNEEATAERTIYFFILISIFILAIAWVNYINLSTARAMERAREVGIKKSIGVSRRELIMQFSFEAVVVNFISTLLAILLAMGLLPILNAILEKHLTFDLTDIRFWGIVGVLFAVGSILSGGYPALVLSSFKPVAALKGSTNQTPAGFSLRKALVVFQFASSFILIAGTFTIYRQLFYMQTQNKGFTMEQMLVFNGPSVLGKEEWPKIEEKMISLKNEVTKIASVERVTTSGVVPGGGYNWGTSMRKLGTPETESKGGSLANVDTDFLDTYGMTLVAGKNWNPDNASDMDKVMINEAAVKAFGLGSPEKAIEEKLLLGGGDTVGIAGVIKDYHWNSLREAHTPFLLGPAKIRGRYYSVLLSGSDFQEAIKQIESKYKEIFPGNPFDYFFLDDFFDKQYRDDQQFGKIFSLFAVQAIIIACLGLWGLAAFSTKLKLREIGIRKVLGASVQSIMSLLSTQYFRLLLIATVISAPLAWWGITTWLDAFAFKISITWDLFVVPAVLLFTIALGTVSVQILHGANVNPAKVLRSE